MANYSDADIKSLRARAAMLQEPTKRIDQAGGMIVPMSPLEGLANGLKQGYAAYLSGKADTQEQEKENAYRDTLNQARVAMMNKADPSEIMGILAGNDQTANKAFDMYGDQQKSDRMTALMRNFYASQKDPEMKKVFEASLMGEKGTTIKGIIEGTNGITPEAWAAANGYTVLIPTASQGFNDPQPKPQSIGMTPPPASQGFNDPQSTGMTPPPAPNMPPPSAPNVTSQQPDVSLGQSSGIPPISMQSLETPQPKQTGMTQPAAPLPTNGGAKPFMPAIEAAGLKAGAEQDAKNQSDINSLKGKTANSPMPEGALKELNNAQELQARFNATKADLMETNKLISSGKLDLGLLENMANRGLNYVGMSNENSRNYSTFKSTIENLRNNILLAAKGTQTEGDADRALSQIINDINNNKNVEKRFNELIKMNDNYEKIEQSKINNISENYQKNVPGAIEVQPTVTGASNMVNSKELLKQKYPFLK